VHFVHGLKLVAGANAACLWSDNGQDIEVGWQSLLQVHESEAADSYKVRDRRGFHVLHCWSYQLQVLLQNKSLETCRSLSHRQSLRIP
jgi:hypothetical protein